LESDFLRELTEESVSLRHAVTHALAELGDARAIEPLLAALTSEDDDLVKAAIPAAARFKDPRIFDALAATLKRPHDRGLAATHLMDIDEARAVPVLVARIANLVDAPMLCIEALGGSHQPAAEQALARALKSMLLNGSFGGMLHEQDDLVYWQMPSRKPSTLDILPLAYARSAGKSATPLLQLALRGPNWRLRVGAARALATIADLAAIDDLTIALRDRCWPVRLAALNALMGLPDPRSLAAIKSAQDDGHFSVRRYARDLREPKRSP